MGILADIINKKVNKIIDDKIEEKQKQKQEADIDENIIRYNRLWLSKIIHETGFAVTDNKNKVDNILKKLNERNGHCPCGGMTDEFICPCRMMREYGTCKCGLYRDIKDIEPRDSKSTGRIKV